MCRLLLSLAIALALSDTVHAQQRPATVRGQAAAARNPNAVVPGYTRRNIQGFTLLIHQEVFKHNDDPSWQRKPIEVLELELRTIAQSLPERTLRVLRRLLIWVEWDDQNDPDAGRAVAKYYGVFGNRALWQLAQNKHPGKANNIEIINMRSLTREHQPGVKLERCVILHELVHAVHFQLFGPQSQIIRSTYAQAMERGLYDQTQDVYNRTIRPYARASEAEYFAEISCAYLNRLHYFPFDRDDLKEHDPAGYRLMELTWGPPTKLEAVKKADSARVAQARLYRARQLNALNRNDEARKVLNDLIATYPKTPAAESAKQLLAQLPMKSMADSKTEP